jgi:hypothetical protein
VFYGSLWEIAILDPFYSYARLEASASAGALLLTGAIGPVRFFSSFGQLTLGYLLPISAKETKTSTELKLLVEREVLRDHPECVNAEVIIDPPEGVTPGVLRSTAKAPP